MKNFKNILMLMFLSLATIAIALTQSATAAISLTPSGETREVGGVGGDLITPVTCPIGTIAIGMEGKEISNPTAQYDGFGFLSDYLTRCGTMSINYSTGEILTQYTTSTNNTSVYMKEPRGLPKIIDCPIGYTVSGYTGYQRRNAQFNNIYLVDALQPRCGKLSYDINTKKVIIGLSETILATATQYIPSAAGAGAELIPNADCPKPSIITGITGRIGELFDRFAMQCSTINQASIEISISGANYADYKVVAMDKAGIKTELSHKSPQVLAPSEYTLVLENKITGKTQSNFICTPSVLLNAAPYTINIVNNSTVMCTIDTDVIPLNILTVESTTPSSIDYQSVNSVRPIITGNSKYDTAIMVTDQDNTTICVTVSDSQGKWKCIPTNDLIINKKYDLIASEGESRNSNLAKVIVVEKSPIVITPIENPIGKPTLIEPIKEEIVKPEIMTPQPQILEKKSQPETYLTRTGGRSGIITASFAIVVTALYTLKKLKSE
jgi:hypothetical protein